MSFDLFALPSIGPYLGVSLDSKVTFQTGSGPRTFRVIVYAAYNAYGLIGSEHNGIAIFDEDNQTVLMDRGNQVPSGYYGPARHQTCAALHLVTDIRWEGFREYVSTHPYSRGRI
jgi:hypothetical protein